jgi:protein-S-isoprenylcysteine O-methyltransferase Ste14
MLTAPPVRVLWFRESQIVIAYMQGLELKIPPPAVTLLAGVAMWGISKIAPTLESPLFILLTVAGAIALVGIGFGLAGVIAFRRARTSIDPRKPETASSLVCSGVYRITRNPMYVGLVFLLVAWAVVLSCPWALLGPLVFILYIGRFQITPEERVLSAMFGAHYAGYKSKVRRWL